MTESQSVVDINPIKHEVAYFKIFIVFWRNFFYSVSCTEWSIMREKYESLSLSDLKEIARIRGIKGTSSMKKSDVIDAMVALDEKEIKAGYQKFREQKNNQEINIIAKKHGIEIQSLQAFIQEIIDRMIFDGEKLGDLLTPLDLSWRERTQKELDLMDDLIPLLKKLADGREIVGLNAYE